MFEYPIKQNITKSEKHFLRKVGKCPKCKERELRPQVCRTTHGEMRGHITYMNCWECDNCGHEVESKKSFTNI
jgi:hypothetical protein